MSEATPSKRGRWRLLYRSDAGQFTGWQIATPAGEGLNVKLAGGTTFDEGRCALHRLMASANVCADMDDPVNEVETLIRSARELASYKKLWELWERSKTRIAIDDPIRTPYDEIATLRKRVAELEAKPAAAPKDELAKLRTGISELRSTLQQLSDDFHRYANPNRTPPGKLARAARVLKETAELEGGAA